MIGIVIQDFAWITLEVISFLWVAYGVLVISVLGPSATNRKIIDYLGSRTFLNFGSKNKLRTYIVISGVLLLIVFIIVGFLDFLGIIDTGINENTWNIVEFFVTMWLMAPFILEYHLKDRKL